MKIYLQDKIKHLKSMKGCESFLTCIFSKYRNNRFFTLSTVVRVNQIETSRDVSNGEDESSIISMCCGYVDKYISTYYF